MTKCRGRRGRWAGLAVLSSVLAAGGALAQVTPPVTPPAKPRPPAVSREQNNPAEQPGPVGRERATDVFSGPPKEVCQLSDDPSLGFEFRQGVLDDPARILSERDKRLAWESSLGRTIT